MNPKCSISLWFRVQFAARVPRAVTRVTVYHLLCIPVGNNRDDTRKAMKTLTLVTVLLFFFCKKKTNVSERSRLGDLGDVQLSWAGQSLGSS